MKTSGSFFTGGGLFDVGAQAAGYKIIWGVEKDDKIASVARLNGFPVITGDVINIDLTKLERPDHFHSSPPCPSFSVANNKKGETELDIAMAEAVCQALVYFKSDTFTLENVVGYRNSESFRKIAECLSNLGYWWDATNLNAADFGVPQTRDRLWIRACRGLLRGYPPAEPWKGWYQAIEDLIPSLPDSQFAPWQLARLPEEYKEFMIGNGTYSSAVEKDSPAPTITSNVNQGNLRALVAQVQGENGKGFRYGDEPIQTLTVNHTAGKYRAFIFPGAGNTAIADAEPGRGVRYEHEPAHTVASDGGGRIPKAFIVGDQKEQIADSERPAFTVRAGENGGTGPRAYTNGRVVKLDIHCLGRFQTVPDWYQGLTVKINGNGVPCLMAQKILETL